MENKKPIRAEINFSGMNPMKIVPLGDVPASPPSPAQAAALEPITTSVLNYLRAARELAANKYRHLEAEIPKYLSNPGNVLIALCSDGIVIRYEAKQTDGLGQLGAARLEGDIGFGAALLSQNLVHIATPERPRPSSSEFGVEVKLSLVSAATNKERDITAHRVWFQAELQRNSGASQGGRPYRLLSVLNMIEFQIHGTFSNQERGGEESFIAHSTFPLLAGWSCIEVFPDYHLDLWKPDFAALWAENDILGALLVSQTRETRFNTLDPRAAARRRYAKLLKEFRTLLDSNPGREQSLQSFLQQNPVLICPSHTLMRPKLSFGKTVSDFVFREASQDYLLVEIERSTLRLFREDGHPTAELTHAQGQVLDWKRYVQDNLNTVQREMGLQGITPNPYGLVVIGRSKDLSSENRRKLKLMENESPKLRIVTFDDLYDEAKAVIENLLGPIWDTGGETLIFFPTPA